MPKKLYIISGLGAGYDVLEKIKFPETVEPIFIPWLVPEKNESFPHYVERMASGINGEEGFFLMGYSFGGFIVQEIDKIIPAEKVVILASIKSDSEKPFLLKMFQRTRLAPFIPIWIFNEKSYRSYIWFRNLITSKGIKVMRFFKVKDAYYLKWSIAKIVHWQFSANHKTIQISGDKDIVFPIKNSNPDYIIKGGTHLFPAIKANEVSRILSEIFRC
ncbi:hypothetical protein [Riemerella columbipharyngis]|uniref:Pimeloyl-ACP methyl ester carboxylesterase n=1 Tax=Riemerella columbipharyngis TaxID=1071918 RepID=A0A1G7D5H7_9FLAO|nr:hypothetical protein [Riemerella columbipharyngis]SDE46779.1 hypothetical protein SAMN05421544_11019 [Riemerella columbipharyngis]